MTPAVQIDLFQIPRPARRETGRARRRDPDTAKKAAGSVEVTDLEGRVVQALKLCRAGMTTHELARILKLELVTVSPRMRPLAEKGLVYDSRERRRGESGRSSIVWKATEGDG